MKTDGDKRIATFGEEIPATILYLKDPTPYGRPVPLIYGTTWTSGYVVWSGPVLNLWYPGSTVNGYFYANHTTHHEWTYGVSAAYILCEGPITDVVDAYIGVGDVHFASALPSFDTGTEIARKIGASNLPGSAGLFPPANEEDGYFFDGSTPWTQYTVALGVGPGSTTALPRRFKKTAGFSWGVLPIGQDQTGSVRLRFKVKGFLSSNADGANPADVLSDLWDRSGLDTDLLDTGEFYEGYLSDPDRAKWRVNIALTDQGNALTVLDDLLASTFSTAVTLEDNTVRILPRDYAGESPVATSLGQGDFLLDDPSADPIIVHRKPYADCFNCVPIQIASTNYTSTSWVTYENTMYAQAHPHDMEPTGVHRQGLQTARFVSSADHAYALSALEAERSYTQRSTYSFKLPIRWCVLQPGDLLSLNEPNLGLDDKHVRITSLEESADGIVSVEAEDWFGVIAFDTPEISTPDGLEGDHPEPPAPVDEIDLADIEAQLEALAADDKLTPSEKRSVTADMQQVWGDVGSLVALGSLGATMSPIGEWVAETTYELGDVITQPDSDPPIYFACTTAGDTGASEPTWAFVGTVEDGTAEWTYSPNCNAAAIRAATSAHESCIHALTQYCLAAPPTRGDAAEAPTETEITIINAPDQATPDFFPGYLFFTPLGQAPTFTHGALIWQGTSLEEATATAIVSSNYTVTNGTIAIAVVSGAFETGTAYVQTGALANGLGFAGELDSTINSFSFSPPIVSDYNVWEAVSDDTATDKTITIDGPVFRALFFGAFSSRAALASLVSGAQLSVVGGTVITPAGGADVMSGTYAEMVAYVTADTGTFWIVTDDPGADHYGEIYQWSGASWGRVVGYGYSGSTGTVPPGSPPPVGTPVLPPSWVGDVLSQGLPTGIPQTIQQLVAQSYNAGTVQAATQMVEKLKGTADGTGQATVMAEALDSLIAIAEGNTDIPGLTPIAQMAVSCLALGDTVILGNTIKNVLANLSASGVTKADAAVKEALKLAGIANGDTILDAIQADVKAAVALAEGDGSGAGTVKAAVVVAGVVAATAGIFGKVMAEKAVFGQVHAGTVIAGVGIFGKVVTGDLVANNAVVGNAYVQNLNVDSVQTIDYTVQSTAVTIAASPAPTQTLVYLTTWPTPAPVVGDALYQGAYSDVVNGVRGVRLITAVNSTNKTLAFTQAGAIWAAGPAAVVKAKDTANETATTGARMRIGQTTSGKTIPAIVTGPEGLRIGALTLNQTWLGQHELGMMAFSWDGANQYATVHRRTKMFEPVVYGELDGTINRVAMRVNFHSLGPTRDTAKYLVMVSDEYLGSWTSSAHIVPRWSYAASTYFTIALNNRQVGSWLDVMPYGGRPGYPGKISITVIDWSGVGFDGSYNYDVRT